MPTAHELAFVVPIPRGHQVLVVTFTGQGKSPTMVLDRTASTIYCPDALWGPLHQDPVTAVTDPVAVITRFAWTVKSTTEGVCAGSLVSTNSSGGDRHEVKTILLVEASR
jgi:hypothetical protein